MGVFASIATIFVENLIAVTSLLAAGFMFIEYYRRRRKLDTLFFACTLAFVGIGFASAFLGQLLYVYFGDGLGGSLVHAQKYLMLTAGLFMVLGTLNAYGVKHKRAWAVLGVSVFLGSLVFFMTRNSVVVTVDGIAFSSSGLWDFIAIRLPWLVANMVLLCVSGVSFFRGRMVNRRYTEPDLYLFRSALIGLLVIATLLLIVVLTLGEFLWVVFVLVLFQMITFFFGATAKGHHDEVVASHPPNIVNRSLVFKALAVNTALFWLLAFSLVVITATYFSSSLVAERQSVMTRDLRLLVTAHQDASQHLLQNASLFAEYPAVIGMVKDGGNIDRTQMNAMLHQLGVGRTVLYVLGRDGRVVYGTNTSSASAQALQRSDIVRRALSGKPVAGIEIDPAIGGWAVRAAAPVILDDGSVGGVVVDTDAVSAMALKDFSAFTISKATGYGFISSTNDNVFVAGTPLDAVTLHGFERHVSGTHVVQSSTLGGDLYYVAGVQQTDGTYDGYFYIYLTRAAMSAEIFRILSVIMIFVTLFVLIVASVLVFSMLVVLRPIRELKEAASRIKHGDYDLHITYSKPDELGQLATAFNEMSTTIKERTSKLNEALRQQHDFLTHTAHEMRTPLNIFRWSLEMLRFGDTGPLNKEQLELIEQMHQTNERIRKLVMNLIDASRIERGMLELRRDFVPVEDVIDDAAGALSVLIREKNINLHWNKPENPYPKVYADQDRLYQVMLNLLSNAVKYTHRNGHIEIEAKEVRRSGPSGREGSFLQISVEDNGRGIPKDQQGKVFTRFFRAKNVMNEEFEGTGLGLFITKQLVELHGGEVWFKSEENEGSTFTFTVPTKKP